MARVSEYTVKEVHAMILWYYPLRAVATASRRLWLLVRLMDVDRALSRLSLEKRQAVWLTSVGMTGREAADTLGLPHMTVVDRYWKAIDQVVTTLNGGTSEHPET